MKKICLPSTVFVCLLISVLPAFPQESSLKTVGQEVYPKYFEADGKTLGVCAEIIYAIEKKTKIDIAGVNRKLPFKRILSHVEEGRVDFFLGVSKNKDREKRFDYIDPPLYPVNFVFVKRAEDSVVINSIDDIRKLGKNGKILVPAGTGAHRFLEKQGGLELDTGGKYVKANLKKLISGRGRFFFHHDLGIKSTIKKENFGDQLTVVPHSFKKTHHYAIFSKKAPLELVKKFEKALQELKKEGELEKIHRKYVSLN